MTDNMEDLRIQVLMGSIQEKKMVEDAAEKECRSLSNFCRLAILEKINKDLEE